MHKILITDPLASEGIDYLNAQTDIDTELAHDLNEEQLKQRLGGYDALIVRSSTRVTRQLLAGHSRLQVIGRAGTGVDNIDVEAATERGIAVLNSPDANARAVAELVIALMLALARNLPVADHSVRNGRWEKTGFNGTELAGKTLGIVGYGAIGRIVARLGANLGMSVLVHDPYVNESVFDDDVTTVSLPDLLSRCDYVSLHCPLSAATEHLINTERLQQMKPGARLINCARGGLVDEQALLQFIRAGRLAGAALDVFAQEPPAGSPLLEMKQCIFTPHLGASTREAQSAVGLEIARNIVEYLRTGMAPGAVNLPRLPSEQMKRLRPYQQLARKLGRVLVHLFEEPIQQLQVTLHGRLAELDARMIGTAALAGILEDYLSVPVNPINALHLAHRQGITLTDARAEDSRGYLSLVSLQAHGGSQTHTLSGTLYDDRHPRLVSFDDCEVEASLESRLLITRHDDRPGVIGQIGTILGDAGINISRMALGIPEGACGPAVAILSVARVPSAKVIEQLTAIPTIHRIVAISA